MLRNPGLAALCLLLLTGLAHAQQTDKECRTPNRIFFPTSRQDGDNKLYICDGSQLETLFSATASPIQLSVPGNLIMEGHVSIGTPKTTWPLTIAKTEAGKGLYIDDTSGSTAPHDFAQDIEVYNVTGKLTDYRGGLRVHIDPSNTTSSIAKLVGIGVGAHAINSSAISILADGNKSLGINNYSRGIVGYFQTTGQPSGTDSTVGMQLNHQSTGNAISLYQQSSNMTGDFIYINAKNAGSGSFNGNFLDFNVNGQPEVVLTHTGNLSLAGSVLTKTGFLAGNNVPYWLGSANQGALYDDGTNVVLNPRLSGQGNVVIPEGLLGVGTTTPKATLDIKGYARMALNSTAPTACDSSNPGSIALTSHARICVCDGTAWNFDSTGAACTW